MNPFFVTDFSISDSLKTVRKSVLIYETIIIDIEGMEYEVLSQYDLLNKGPKVITLEVMRNNVEYGQKVIRLLEDADYFMYVKIYSNITFVKNEYKEQIYSL